MCPEVIRQLLYLIVSFYIRVFWLNATCSGAMSSVITQKVKVSIYYFLLVFVLSLHKTVNWKEFLPKKEKWTSWLPELQPETERQLDECLLPITNNIFDPIWSLGGYTVNVKIYSHMFVHPSNTFRSGIEWNNGHLLWPRRNCTHVANLITALRP